MKLLTKLERLIAGWLKNVPHLPANVRTWVGDNAWWIVLVGAILSAIAALSLVITLSTSISVLSSPAVSFYTSASIVSWIIVTSLVSLVFVIIECVLLVMAVTPLKEKQKKGWVLLFATWAVGVVSTVVTAILTLNPFSVIGSLILGALWAAVGAYFIFEIHGQFAHVERSKGIKKA